MNVRPFFSSETHQVMRRTGGGRVHSSSEGAGWCSLFASVQTETTAEGTFDAVKDHLLVLPVKQPIWFLGRIGDCRQPRLLPPGSISLTPGGMDFELRTDAGQQNFDTIHLYLREDLLREIFAELSDGKEGPGLTPLIGVMDPVIYSIASEIYRMLRAPGRSDAFYVETLARAAATRLIRGHALSEPAETKAAEELAPQQFSRAIEYIETYLAEPMTLNDIAEAAGISTARLMRDFKRNTNHAPYDYVIRTRVERARHLLTTTRCPLADIAIQCGFADQQHMTRIMRRMAGTTPGALRRR